MRVTLSFLAVTLLGLVSCNAPPREPEVENLCRGPAGSVDLKMEHGQRRIRYTPRAQEGKVADSETIMPYVYTNDYNRSIKTEADASSFCITGIVPVLSPPQQRWM